MAKSVDYPKVGASYLLGLAMCLAGFNKLTPFMSEDLHKELHAQLDIFAREVWSFLGLSGVEMAVYVGLVESCCGVFLFVPSLRKSAIWLNPITLIGAVITHQVMQDGRMLPAAVLLALNGYLLWATWGDPWAPPPRKKSPQPPAKKETRRAKLFGRGKVSKD